MSMVAAHAGATGVPHRPPVLLRALILAGAALLLIPGNAFGALPPHVVESTASPDACAICHRAHTGNVDLQYRTTLSTEPTGNALTIAPAPEPGTPGFPAPNRGDVGLCFTCHGAAGLGSDLDVETAFSLASTHTIAPLASTFGPSPKMCGSCHDPHGSAKVTPGGAPYARLLRSWVNTTTTAFSAEEYCAACHVARAASRFDSVAVYRRTGHYSGMPDPVSGTKVRCVSCHAAHGSSIEPLISTRVTPPAAPDTATIVANDRRQCVACHPDPAHTWSGETTYAVSAHALSAKTTAVLGEWPAAGAVRRVGECQVCHAPMGRGDGAGGTIPKLGEKAGRQLCDTCHQAAGPATTDVKSLAYPAGETASTELVVSWAPDARSVHTGRTDIYARALTGAAPRPLAGPRTFAAPGASGAIASGDVDGDGIVELVRGDATANTLTIIDRDVLRGLSAGSPQAVLGSPDYIAIGRFVEPTAAETLAGAGARPQIALVDAAAGKLWLYENLVGGALTLIDSGAGDGSYVLGGTGTGLAAGVFTGGTLPGLAVTVTGPDELQLYVQDGGSPDRLTSAGTAPLASAPSGPSVGDLTGTATGEIAVCLAGGTVPIFDGTAALLTTLGPVATAGAPTASAIGDVIPASAGDEVAVAVDDPAGPARLSILTYANVEFDYSRAGAPVASSGSVIVADIDGDSIAETVVGNAGQWGGAGAMSAASVDVYRPNALGTALLFDATLVSGSAALAGAAPGLVVADLGAVVPSRHPIEEVSASHVSTETGAFARHVTCSDCHDSHEASSGVAAVAPYVKGVMRGAWGPGVTNTAAGVQTLAASARAVREYEVCFKCHATTAGGRADLASLVNTQNVSVHAVEGSSTAPMALSGSYEPGWSNDSILRCTDCHGNSVAPPEAKGSHRSGEAPLLKAPYAATPASDGALLCYACHLETTYRDGVAGTDGGALTSSRFYDATLLAPDRRALHSFHVAAPASGGMGFACGDCHVSHGSVLQPHILRGDIGYDHETGGAGTNSGTCDTTACHAAPHVYVGP